MIRRARGLGSASQLKSRRLPDGLTHRGMRLSEYGPAIIDLLGGGCPPDSLWHRASNDMMINEFYH